MTDAAQKAMVKSCDMATEMQEHAIATGQAVRLS